MMIRTIWLILGDTCNLNCSYCQQHIIKNNYNFNPKIIQYIKNICNGSHHNVKILFYGGEPLLYFNIIEDVVNQTKNIENIEYAIDTNGKILNQEMVEFFNQYHFTVNISWDGPNSIITRGYDVIKEKKNLLLQLQYMKLSGVITNKCYPLEFCSEMDKFIVQWNNLHDDTHICRPILQLIKTDDMSTDLINFDYTRLSKETELILKYYIDYLYNIVSYSTKCDLGRFLTHVSYKEETYDIVPCKPGYTNMNMNINGEIYYCHNNRTIVGNVDNNIEELRNNIHKVDKTPENYNELCKNCDIIGYCRCGCCEVDLQGRKKYYCQAKRSIYTILNQYKDTILSLEQR